MEVCGLTRVCDSLLSAIWELVKVVEVYMVGINVGDLLGCSIHWVVEC